MKRSFGKKVCSLVLSLAMILSYAPHTIFAEDEPDTTRVGAYVDVGVRRVYNETTGTYDVFPLVPADAVGNTNGWQVVSQLYQGCGATNKIAFDADGTQLTSPDDPDAFIRLQKNVVPTDRENEFLVYMSVDYRELLQTFFLTTGYGATPSNQHHGTELGQLVSTMGGNNSVIVTAEPGIYTNFAYFTIYDYYGNVLFDDMPLYWSQGNNGTIYLQLAPDQYILLGISVQKNSTAPLITFSLEATEAFYDAMNRMTGLTVTDSMGGGSGSGTSLGEYIEFMGFIAGDYDDATVFDPDTNTLSWAPLANLSCEQSQRVYTTDDGITESTWFLNVSQLVYKVRLKTEASGFQSCAANMDSTVSEPESYRANNSAVLTRTDPDTLQTETIGTFPVPMVRGLLYDTPVIDKVDANGTPVPGAVFTLTGTGSSPLTFTSDGSASFQLTGIPTGTYTLSETTVPAGFAQAADRTYVFNYTADPSDYIVGGTNTDAVLRNGTVPLTETIVEPVDYSATTSVTAEKVWNDADDQDGLRPASVTFRLFRTVNGVTTAVSGSDRVLDAVGGWSATWDELPRYDGTDPVTYSIKELTPGVSPTVIEATSDSDNVFDSNYTVSYDGLTVTNTHVPETRTVTVTKVWNDANDQDGIRPGSVTVQLYKQVGTGAVTAVPGATVTLSDANSWSDSFDNLPGYEGGLAVTYTVGETSVPTGYTLTGITGNESDGYTVTNTHTPATKSVTVTKVWNDANNQDGLRPGSVTVQLFMQRGGTGMFVSVVGGSATLDASGSWSYTFTNLPAFEYGVALTYTVDEVSVPAGYTKTGITGNEESGYTITNAHTPVTKSVTVTKVWDDADNQDGIRPGSVSVQLYKQVGTNGTVEPVIGAFVALTAAGSWSYTFRNLPAFESGHPITYTVDETSVPALYTKTGITGNETDGYVITNAHTPATKTVTVTKIWDDADNQDGLRPPTVTVQLYKQVGTGAVAAVPGEFLSLNAVGAWSGSFTDLPAFENGVAITYTVGEASVPAGYTMTGIAGNENAGYTITNTHTPATKSVTVTKVWNDADDQDGLRPVDVTVQLYKQVGGGSVIAVVGETVSLDEVNNWNASFDDLPAFEHGTAIIYTVDEVGVPTGYTKTGITGSESEGYVITNAHTPATKSVTVTKVWNDASNQDGIRPGYVTVQLYKQVGTGAVVAVTGATVTLNAAGSWTGSFDNLPAFEGGVAIVYTVDEVAVPTGYTKTGISGNETEGYVITNAHTPATKSVTVTKVWNDADNQDGLRPGSITVQLYKQVGTGAVVAVTGATVTLDAAGSWTGSFDDLPAFENGTAITYTVDEVAVPTGYTKTGITGNETDGYIITNAHTPATKTVTVTKVWNDADDQDGIRPGSITVQLYKQVGTGAVVAVTGATVTLNAAGSWTDSFDNLPAFESGVAIVYTVDEVAVPTGYTKTGITGSETDGYIITNAHTPATESVTVTKVWNDADDQDGIRPGSVTVQLYKQVGTGAAVAVPGATLTLNAAGSWTASFDNLPSFENGTAITYTVDEVAVPTGYTKTGITGNETDGYTITNTHTPATKSVTVTKVWNDADNQDGIRPGAVIVQLFKQRGGTGMFVSVVGGSVALDASGNWSYTFTNLPAFENGVALTYIVDEVFVPTGYAKTSIVGSETLGFFITNEHTPATESFTVTKVWNDADNQDGLRPASVTVQLYKQVGTGAVVAVPGTTLTLNAAGSWTGSFDDLPSFEGGVAVTYTVAEASVPAGYTMTGITGSEAAGYTITNTHTPATKTVTVTKVWDDADNQDGLRPANVTVQLYKHGNGYVAMMPGRILTLDATGSWTGSFENLPAFENGFPLTYTVDETSVPAGYTQTGITGNDTDGYVITNAHTPATKSVTVTKVWNDAGNQDGIRPATVTVQLYKQVGTGAAVAVPGVTLTLDAAGSWTGSFDDLPAFEGGVAIVYSVDEAAVPVGYTKTGISGSETAGYTITNAHTPGSKSVAVTKVWNDADNQDGLRPGSITVQLYKQVGTGAAVAVTGATVTLNSANTWTASFNDLPAFEGGVAIVYTVDEVAVPTGYTKTGIIGNETEGYVITNAHTPATKSVTVTKTWNDASNQDGIRPGSITVQLYKQVGTGAVVAVTGATVTLNAANTWTDSFDDLPAFENGVEIIYTVDEAAVPTGYTKTGISGNEEGGYTITNAHIPATESVAVTKVWNDADNQDGLRPGSITVQLYKQVGTGAIVAVSGATVTLNAANTWTDSFDNLPAFEGGVAVTYTVDEVAVPTGYTKTGIIGNETEGYVITNAHTPATKSVTVTKTWNDADNQDGIRPGSITVQLYKQVGTGAIVAVTGATVTLNAANTWTASFNNLPAFEGGAAIVYTVDEVAVPTGYTKTGITGNESDGYTITNAHTPATKSVAVTKTWNDADNQDGIRPGSITVQLYKQVGTGAVVAVTGATVTLNAAGTWTGSFDNLPAFEGGVAITYTVDEVAVPTGYTKTGITGNETDGYVITNAHTPATKSVTVTKVWNDANNQDGIRPGSITVQLYKQVGTGAVVAVTGATVTLNAAGTWTGSFDNLPAFEGGVAITYTVDEVAAPTGYTKTGISGNETDGYVITNAHTPATKSVTVTKTWNDADNQDGLRPANVTVQLYKQVGTGAVVAVPGATVTLNAANTWTASFGDLPAFEGGVAVTYTVDEVAVPTGYTVTGITGSEAEGYVITNAHTPETVDVKVTVDWDDVDDADGLRPLSVYLQLFRVKADGSSEVIDDVTLVEADGVWEHSFTGLPRFENGVEIEYYIDQAEVDFYGIQISGNAKDGFFFLNIHVPLPPTGVSMGLGLWTVMMLLSAAGYLALCRSKKRLNGKK